MNKNLSTIATAAILLSSTLHAQEPNEKMDFIEFKVGGWSFNDSDEDMNEKHNGVGLEYYRSFSKNDKHLIGGSLWYMRDAYDENSFQVAAVYKYRITFSKIIDSLDLNFNLGLNNRHYQMEEYTLNNENKKVYKHERETRITAVPYVTLNVTENIQADFVYTPKDWANSLTESNEVFFMRFGYRF